MSNCYGQERQNTALYKKKKKRTETSRLALTEAFRVAHKAFMNPSSYFSKSCTLSYESFLFSERGLLFQGEEFVLMCHKCGCVGLMTHGYHETRQITSDYILTCCFSVVKLHKTFFLKISFMSLSFLELYI